MMERNGTARTTRTRRASARTRTARRRRGTNLLCCFVLLSSRDCVLCLGRAIYLVDAVSPYPYPLWHAYSYTLPSHHRLHTYICTVYLRFFSSLPGSYTNLVLTVTITIVDLFCSCAVVPSRTEGKGCTTGRNWQLRSYLPGIFTIFSGRGSAQHRTYIHCLKNTA